MDPDPAKCSGSGSETLDEISFFAVKNALLDPEATKDEVTVLEIETKGYKEQKVTD